MSSPTVYVIHPDPAVRESVRSLAADMRLHCNTFASTRELVETSADDHRTCMLAYAQANELNGSGKDGVSAGADGSLPMAVVLSSVASDNAKFVQSLRLDASALSSETDISKLEDLLRRGLQAAEQKRLHTERQARARRDRDAISERLARLTESEQQVLDRVLQGRLNKMIARGLDVSVRTVEQRRRNIMNKMEAESLADLVSQVTRLQVYNELLD
jgi:two-component system response regulator FixJ